MKTHLIKLEPQGTLIEVNEETPLVDVLHGYGIEFPCGGKGTCGKCKVHVLKGEIAPSEEHNRRLEELKLPPGWYLACMSRCCSDLSLEVEQFSQLILADESEFIFTPSGGYGIAVDLGTTTLVAQLIDLTNARVLAVETRLNPQMRYGADLISRIQASLDGHAGEMSRMIRDTIGQMAEKMITGKKLTLRKMLLVGNTAMHHLFCGLDLKPLASYPFHSEQLGAQHFKSQELGWNFEVDEGTYFYPAIGSFVGSDILAGILATGLHRKGKFTALIDLGTNGEIALGNKDRIVCASTAAGPAFEGSNISMGMRAVTGAISSVRALGDGLEVQVIGHTQPKGICGSGLIDAVAIGLKQGQIGSFGEIVSGAEKLSIAAPVVLSQADIYEFQLAKAAIATGLTILSRKLSIRVADIETVFIAGAFGTYLHLPHVVETGMIGCEEGRIHKMGNTALIGAKMLLFGEVATAAEILAITEHISLEAYPGFQDTYVEMMKF